MINMAYFREAKLVFHVLSSHCSCIYVSTSLKIIGNIGKNKIWRVGQGNQGSLQLKCHIQYVVIHQ